MILGPNQVLPDEDNLLNLQATLVTQIHRWLLPLYVIGAFLTMLGTLYGTIEIACIIVDEIFRSCVRNWTPEQAQRLRRGCIAWCATIALLILAWLFVRQARPSDTAPTTAAATPASPAQTSTGTTEESTAHRPIREGCESAENPVEYVDDAGQPLHGSPVLWCGLPASMCGSIGVGCLDHSSFLGGSGV